MPAIEQNIRLRCVPQILNLSIVKFLIFLYSCLSIIDEVYAQRCISGGVTAQLPSYLEQEYVDSSAEPTKAALFCGPGLKADAHTLQNHNHPHMNYLPFLMSKKWEAVHVLGMRGFHLGSKYRLQNNRGRLRQLSVRSIKRKRFKFILILQKHIYSFIINKHLHLFVIQRNCG